MNLGRPITVLFSLLGAFVIYRWTKDLYGRRSALFAVLLYTFEPNIIAHSQVITTDLYSIVMVTLATYTFWIFLKSGTTKHAIYASSAESVKEAVRKK
jgi:Gpi18-like mannosyltransferase